MEKAEAASSPQGAMSAWPTPALATVMPQKNCSTVIFLSFHQRSHWELQPSTWPFQTVNIRFASVVHIQWVELLGTAILIPTETQQRGEMDVFAVGGKAHWAQKGSALRWAPLCSLPCQNQQPQPHLSFLFLTKSQESIAGFPAANPRHMLTNIANHTVVLMNCSGKVKCHLDPLCWRNSSYWGSEMTWAEVTQHGTQTFEELLAVPNSLLTKDFIHFSFAPLPRDGHYPAQQALPGGSCLTSGIKA